MGFVLLYPPVYHMNFPQNRRKTKVEHALIFILRTNDYNFIAKEYCNFADAPDVEGQAGAY